MEKPEGYFWSQNLIGRKWYHSSIKSSKMPFGFPLNFFFKEKIYLSQDVYKTKQLEYKVLPNQNSEDGNAPLNDSMHLLQLILIITGTIQKCLKKLHSLLMSWKNI